MVGVGLDQVFMLCYGQAWYPLFREHLALGKPGPKGTLMLGGLCTCPVVAGDLFLANPEQVRVTKVWVSKGMRISNHSGVRASCKCRRVRRHRCRPRRQARADHPPAVASFGRLEACHRRCAMVGVSFSMLSLGWFVCQQHVSRSAEKAEPSVTPIVD